MTIDSPSPQTKSPINSKNPIPGHVQDIENALCAGLHAAKPGFDLQNDSPVHAPANDSFGHPRLGVASDLPAGRSTLEPVRSRLSLHYRHGRDNDWTEPIRDLQTLPARQFAARYNVDIAVVFSAPRSLRGRRARELAGGARPGNPASRCAKLTRNSVLQPATRNPIALAPFRSLNARRSPTPNPRGPYSDSCLLTPDF